MNIGTSVKSLRYGVVGALVISASLFGAVEAKATTYSLTLSQILGFSELPSTGAGVSLSDLGAAGAPFGQLIGGEVKFSGNFGADPTSNLDIGKTFSSTGTGVDTFELLVRNANENPWAFTLSAGGASTGPTTIAVGATTLLSVALGGAFTDIILSVTAGIGHDGTDGIAEFFISGRSDATSPVPLPPALLLFGSGIAGLGLLARRRRQKPVVGSASLV